MGTRDPRIDAYIEKSADFARPILTHLRDVVHAACPDTVEEIKWGMPHFAYQGMLCSMAAFKQHCVFGFWKSALILEGADDGLQSAMGQFGRITSVKDLPAKRVLSGYIKKAMALNEAGIKAPTRKRPTAKQKLTVPDDLSAALKLKKHASARAHFDAFTPSQKREYVDWLDEAKTQATRDKRLASTLEWLAEGKQRNWKYMK